MNEKISIICPSFNHEKYIGFFIDSVLTQTYQNFELIINDDRSTDKTFEIIKTYKDDRIKVFKNLINSGPNYSINQAFKECSGEYVVFCASDDMLRADHLQLIANLFDGDKNIGVVYSNLALIDENNNNYGALKLRYTDSTTKEEILLDFFCNENSLFSPGMAVRRKLLEYVMPFDVSFVNHQDSYIHIRLLSISDCFFNKEESVLYRKEINSNNSLSNNSIGKFRTLLETRRLMNEFLYINNSKFYELLSLRFNVDFKHDKLKYFNLGLCALRLKDFEKKKWGYDIIMDYIYKNGFDNIYEYLGFDFKSYLELTKSNIYLNHDNDDKLLKKYKKYKKITKIVVAVLLASLMLNIYFFIGEL